MGNQEITILRATSLDNAVITEINTSIPEFTWDPGNAARFPQDPDNLLLLATRGETICGVLYGYRLQRLDARRAEVLLYSIDVQEGFRRQGVGSQLIEATKRWAVTKGAEGVWVLTNRSNTAAMAMYASTGGNDEDPGDIAVFVYDLNP